MEYTRIPYVEKKISRLFFGTAGPAFLRGEDQNELLDEVFAAGVNAFDTARDYQLAERSLGDWIDSRGIRDQVVILGKCGHPDETTWRKRINEKEIREDFAVSSNYLKTDYFDIYLLHRDDPDVEASMIVEIFNALHAEGKIGAFGGSNWSVARIQEANEYAYSHNLIPFTVTSPNFGLANQVEDPWKGVCTTISGPEHAADRDWYRANQMAVVAYSSLGRGLFSGRVRSDEPEKASLVMDEGAMRGYGYPENFERLRRCEELAKTRGCTVPQIAMAWIYHQQLNMFAIVSTAKPDRMKENIAALEIELTEEECRYLEGQGVGSIVPPCFV